MICEKCVYVPEWEVISFFLLQFNKTLIKPRKSRIYLLLPSFAFSSCVGINSIETMFTMFTAVNYKTQLYL